MRTLREFFANLPYFSAKREQSLKVVYVALAFLSFHWSLITYMNASFLGTFMSDTYVSLLFVLGSALLLFPFFWMPRFLRALGNYRLTLLLTVLEFCAVLGMAFATSAFFASLFFPDALCFSPADTI